MALFGRKGGGQHRRFRMRQRALSIGDDYWIEDDAGNKAFKVNGKALRMRNTWVLEDLGGGEAATIEEHHLGRDKVVIEIAGRTTTVKKALIGIRDRFDVDVELGKALKVHGRITDHEYEVERDGDTVATVSKKWFRVRETYGVEIRRPEDTVLLLAVTVAVDALARD